LRLAVIIPLPLSSYCHRQEFVIKTLVSFSGEVIDPDLGGAFTEVAVNQGIEEKQPSEKFAGDDYQLLLVAEKYQTSFDQPLLHTMYYISHFNHGRPFILASHSQGSQVMEFLLVRYMKAHPDVYKRMIVAYVVGYSVTPSYLAQHPFHKFAKGPNDTGVIASWNTEAPTIAAPNPVLLPGGLVINQRARERRRARRTLLRRELGSSPASCGTRALAAARRSQRSGSKPVLSVSPLCDAGQARFLRTRRLPVCQLHAAILTVGLLLVSVGIGTSPPRSPITLTSWVSLGTTILVFW
jgi:hypothetical protein